MSNILVGGQAVIEGVMMRAPGVMAIAVRRTDGSIQLHTDHPVSLIDRYPILGKPVIRGILAFVQALVFGIKALNFSSNVALSDINAAERNETVKSAHMVSATDGFSTITMIGMLVFTLSLSIVVFFFLPLLLTDFSARFFPSIADNALLYNLIDSLIRIVFLIAYMIGISFFPDIRRVFQYHGAEHKSIYTYEASLPLTVENARRFTTLHPRCGTAFLILVAVLAMIMFSLIPKEADIATKMILRILLLPLIAGIAFEIMRKSGEGSHPFFRLVIQPGLWLQRITTREPDDAQLEVALSALEHALRESDSQSRDLIV